MSTEKFNNKFRIPSARLQNWNYANEAKYFVTICTKNRQNYFGEIVVPTVPNVVVVRNHDRNQYYNQPQLGKLPIQNGINLLKYDPI